MTPATPPRAATWLLMRLASGAQRSALAGDLMEQYQRTRSPAWYWTQALTAMVVGGAWDLADHWLLAGRAIAMWWVLSWVSGWVTTAVHQSLGLVVWNWSVDHGFDMFRVFWFGRPRLGNPVLLALACINSIWIGWVVVRAHHRHAAAVLLTAASVIVAYTVFVRFTWLTAVWPGTFFAAAPLVATTPFLVAAIAVPICFLIGGVLGSQPAEGTEDTLLIANE
jgi:hypothetical protein